MTAPVYIAPLEGVSAGLALVLSGDEGHHAATVRRTRVGERIDVVDGAGTRARCEVTASARGSLELRVTDVVTEPPPHTPIVLVQALAKGGRDEQAVETATEYGAMGFIPWQSARTIVNWRGKESKGRGRWEATARAAAKQSRRSWLPSVTDVQSTKQLVATLRTAASEGARIFVCHEEGTLPLATALRTDAPRTPAQSAALAGEHTQTGPCYVVVGPEGGITPEELEAFRELGAFIVLLAPHVLRSATAGPYAIATIAALGAA
ncbi:MAG: 16S rRNA (uracil(1498)-N(3))-methyltransferase [Ancrocorticia sp.]